MTYRGLCLTHGFFSCVPLCGFVATILYGGLCLIFGTTFIIAVTYGNKEVFIPAWIIVFVNAAIAAFVAAVIRDGEARVTSFKVCLLVSVPEYGCENRVLLLRACSLHGTQPRSLFVGMVVCVRCKCGLVCRPHSTRCYSPSVFLRVEIFRNGFWVSTWEACAFCTKR